MAKSAKYAAARMALGDFDLTESLLLDPLIEVEEDDSEYSEESQYSSSTAESVQVQQSPIQRAKMFVGEFFPIHGPTHSIIDVLIHRAGSLFGIGRRRGSISSCLCRSSRGGGVYHGGRLRCQCAFRRI